MPKTHRFPLAVFLLLTTVPAALVGAGLWYMASLVPACVTEQKARLTAPDRRYDLIVFSRDCGATTGFNTQAAVIPAGDNLPDDAASFLSIDAAADLQPRWNGAETIELTLPSGVRIYRQDDSVAGIAVSYR